MSDAALCSKSMNYRARYNDLLLSAYDVIDDASRFDDFIDEAYRYFFKEPSQSNRYDDLSEDQLDDFRLEHQADRLSRLLKRSIEMGQDDDQRFHAVLNVDLNSGQTDGNSAAEALLGVALPRATQDLPLDHGTLRAITTLDGQMAEDIVLAQIDSENPQACLALIQRSSETPKNILVSMSFVDWSDQILKRVGDAFGLSDAETEVLAGFLANRSQKEIAEQRQTSVETIKAQSKSILQKSGCARMSDVVKLSASVAYMLRQMPKSDVGSGHEAWTVPTANMRLLDRPEGRQLAYYDYGAGDIPIVFIHGYISGPFFKPEFLQACAMLGLRIICPSRPGFGHSSPSTSRENYTQTIDEDTSALIEALDLKTFVLMVNQGGTCHGFRLARKYQDQIASIYCLDGRIPIDEEHHLDHMHKTARMALIAARHSPSLYKMILKFGINYYRHRGARSYLEMQFKESPYDLASLDDPATLRAKSDGFYHMLAHGEETMVRDAMAAMADWEADLQAVTVPQLWISPQNDKIMSASAIDHKISPLTNREVKTIPGHGSTILYTGQRIVLSELQKVLEMGGMTPPKA